MAKQNDAGVCRKKNGCREYRFAIRIDGKQLEKKEECAARSVRPHEKRNRPISEQFPEKLCHAGNLLYSPIYRASRPAKRFPVP